MAAASQPWLLGLDVGTDSIGWAAFSCASAPRPPAAVKFLSGGVRLFDSGRDPKEHTSYQRERGLKRRARRIPRATRWRKRRLRELLRAGGVTPANEPSAVNAHYLRADGLHKDLAPGNLWTVLMYLANHRGFRSTRLERREAADGAAVAGAADDGDKDAGFWQGAEEALRQRLADMKKELGLAQTPTVGELFARDLREGRPIRMRYGGGGAVAPTRALLEEEFDRVRARQGKAFPSLDWDAVRDAIFDQRPLRTLDGGPCRYFPEEERCERASPSAQEYIVRQTLANLRVPQPYPEPPRKLTDEEYAAGHASLSAMRTIEWPKLRAAMGLKGRKFTLETERSGGRRAARAAEGNQTGAILGALIPGWKNIPLGRKDEIFAALWSLRRARRRLIAFVTDPEGPVGLTDPAAAEDIADAIQFDMPTGRLNISLKAARLIAAELKPGIGMEDAVKHATGQDHWVRGDPKYLGALPYYAQAMPDVGIGGSYDPADKDDPEAFYGRIGNITVHIALNEIAKIVNALRERHGPDLRLVVVETTRELKAGVDERRRIIADQARRERENDGIDAELRKERTWLANARERRLRWRLWTRQKKICPYCGQQIGATDLLTDACAIDHVIARARGGRDTESNMVICHAHENAAKGDRTPWAAFKDRPGWIEIRDDFLSRLDKDTRKALEWRFAEDAATRGERMAEPDDEEGFLPRQMTDTGYIARTAIRYLAHAVPEGERNGVVATRGRLTAWLRTAWDLMPGVKPYELFPIRKEALESDEAARAAVQALEPAHLRKAFEELVRRQRENHERLSKQAGNPTPPDMGYADFCRAALYGTAGGKNRADHRHHFIDAAVIAVTDRARVNWINRLHAMGGSDLLPAPHDLPEPLPEPYDGFRYEVRKAWETMWPSIRPRHGKGGALHAEKLYGVRKKGDGLNNLVLRRSVREMFLDANGKPLPDAQIEKKIAAFASSRMRNRFMALLEAKRAETPSAVLAELCLAAAADTSWGPRGMTGNTLIERRDKTRDDADVVIGFRGNTATAVLTAGNEVYEAWQKFDGKGQPKWQHRVLPWFTAKESNDCDTRPSLGTHCMLVLRKGDLVWWPCRDGDRLFVVKKFNVDGRIFLWPARCVTGRPAAPVVQALFRDINLNSDEGYKFSSAEGIRKAGIRMATVSLLGRLRVK